MDKDKIADNQMKNTMGHFINYVRVATALAVIRSKPPNVSAFEFTRTLCGKYMHTQLKWKSRVHTLEEEVLALRQKLIQSQIKPGHLASIENEEESQPVFPTPPSSSDPDIADQNHSQQIKLSSHVEFLQSVLVLKSACKNNGKVLELDSVTLDTSVKTVRHALSIVENWVCTCNLHNKLPVRTAKHSVEVIVQLVDGSVESGQFHVDVCQAVLNFAESAVKHLLQNNQLNNVSYEEGLQEILMILSKSKFLNSKLQLVLAKCVQEYSEILRQVKHGQITLEPHMFENVCLIFQCLETVIEVAIKSKRKDRTLCEDLYKKLSSELESSLLHISEVFPLFAHYVWHIVGLLQQYSECNK